MKKTALITVLFVLIIHHTMGQKIEDVFTSCSQVKIGDKVSIAIAEFNNYAAFHLRSGIDFPFGNKLIRLLDSTGCFNVFPQQTRTIPGGTQAYFSAEITDYFTSENQLGQPRLEFKGEIRNAVTQQLIVAEKFKYKGKLYTGIGKNKPLETIWNDALNDIAIFLYKNFDTLSKLKRSVSTKTTIGNQTIITNPDVRTKSVLDQINDYEASRRNENFKLSTSYSDYYNDTIYFKSIPRPTMNNFLEYSVNGKKYTFLQNGNIQKNESLSFFATGDTTEGIKVRITSPTITMCGFDIQMFFPIRFPTIRRFHFGTDSTRDSHLPSGREAVTFKISLCSDFVKVSDWSINRKAEHEYDIIASNEEKMSDLVNIESGYVDILYFDAAGKIDARFKFKTKAYKNKKGENVPAATIEGRFDVLGIFHYIPKITDKH